MTIGAPTPSGNATRSSSRGRRLLGVAVVLVGAALMIGGIAAVWFYARKLPGVAAPAAVATAPSPGTPLPPPPELAAPSPDDSEPPAPSTSSSASAPERRKLVLPVAVTPYPEDATAPVPVLGGHPLWGGRDAFVTLTVFADLENPESIALLREILPLKAELGEELRVMFRHLPASDHAAARLAARALAEIHATRGEQAFWHALAAIVRRGDPLGPGLLAPVLDDAGLPGYPLASPNARAEAALADDAELATLLYVRDTPTSFVNGMRVTGFAPRAALAEIVERERRAAYLALANGTPPAAVYTERTRKNFLNLGVNPPARACVADGGSPALGTPGALVTIVEFSDLECELCRQGDLALAAVRKAHPSDVRVVWKNFPLPQHHRARLAANVAFAARRLGGDAAFWAVTHALLDPGVTLDDEGLARAVARAGLDATKILSAARDGGDDASIDEDVKLAESLGITGAPTYFVNGQKVAGALPEPELRALVDKELALGRRVHGQGAGLVGELACGVRSPAKRD
ncbi:MAG TPA: thioredoxin domain-containing protein [Polyangiaceae bacterium]|nr:thioredoxin domain-containing protein [Polyangiaceae bacterium]